MPAAATIGAIGSLGSAGIGYFGAQNAANTQANAYNQALDFQKYAFGVNQGNLNPFIKFGQGAANSLASLYGLNGAQGVNEGWEQFKNLPAYQFPLEQGLRATNMSLNAQGRQMSGAQSKATNNFAQGLASTYMMNNYVNPLTQFAGMGQSAASSLAGVNSNMAGMIGNTMGNMGAASASGMVGGANALSGGLNNLGMYAMMSRFPGMGGSGGGGSFSSYQSPSGLPGGANVGYDSAGDWFNHASPW